MSVAAMLLLVAVSGSEDFPRIEPYRLSSSDQAPVLDGKLEDEVWGRATVVTDFHQIRPTDGGPPSEDSEVRLAYDEDFFYVGIRAYDSRPEEIVARSLIQGNTFFSDDRFEVRFDTFNDRRNAYFFQVNPNGMRREALAGNDYFIEDWDTIWYAEASLQPWGWSAELAVPFKSLSFDPSSDTWGFNLARVIPRKGEEVSWSSRERLLGPSVSGYLDGLEGMRQGLGVELVPSATLKFTERDGEGGDVELEPSVTGFYRFNPFLTGALTLNTDFSATEVDARRINLSRFSLFFPEKRDFFLQDASIFEFAGLETNARPFFSRRIGLAANGEPLDLEAGAKLTGRAGDWNVGALAVQQEPGLAGAAEHLFVGRASRNIMGESSIGMIATHGDPSSAADNSLVGFDFNYRSSDFMDDRTLQGTAWFQRSDTAGIDGSENAFGASLAYPNDRFSWNVDWQRIEKNFNPALGFVNRSGVNQVSGQWRFRHRLEDSAWQWLATRVQFFRADRLAGGLQSQSVFLNLFEGFSRGNDFFTFFVGEERENLQAPFEIFDGVVIPAADYAFERYGLFLETGTQRILSGSLEIVAGDFFGGTNLTLAPGLAWRPNRHFFAGLDYAVNRIRLPQGNFTSRLYRARAEIAFNSDIAWLNFVQGDNVSETISINSRLRWQASPEREIFLVVNQLYEQDGYALLDTEIALKLNFNFRI